MSRAHFAGRLATQVVQASSDPVVLDGGGFWGVVITFEGQVRLWRFAEVRAAALPVSRAKWPGVSGEWRSSMSRDDYTGAVREVRRRVREGEVYQVNICRVLSAELPGDRGALGEGHGETPNSDQPQWDPWALARVLARGNPAPYQAVFDIEAIDGLPRTRIVSASPELFLSRDGDRVASSPIKGTATTPEGLLPKDRAENVMIVDLVRNDLQRVCQAGTIAVEGLLRVEPHPGLVHLVSTVSGRLEAGTSWSQVLAATMPPGSVSGAPKSSALRAIEDLEPVPRGPYCGAIGWVDADAGRAVLAVGIRTFWWQEPEPDAEARGERVVSGDGTAETRLCFGTGAGITWGSDPDAEWEETELKAARLIRLTSASETEEDA